ncbi:MAG: pyridoxamine 5'-phosphate oxidase family protein [Acidimicrobiia bacterium]
MTPIPETYKTPHGLTDDLRAALLERSSVTLGTTNPDGSPHLTVVLFSLDDEGRVQIPTPRTTRKIKNIRANPLVSALGLLTDGWVACTGTARLVDGNEAAQINRGVRERLFTEAGLATMGVFLEAHEDVTIEIEPTKWLSYSTDPIDGWIEAQGIDASAFDGPWMRNLSAEQ